MEVSEIRRVSSIRSKAIRQMLCLSGDAFSTIFSTMQQKYVSRWERGQKHPDSDQLEELLAFLKNPRPWMAKEGLYSDRAGKAYPVHPQVAILYFPWRDPSEFELVDLPLAHPAFGDVDGISPFLREPKFRPRQAKGSEVYGLKALVFGIVDPSIPDEQWQQLLSRCTYPHSKSPFDLIRLLVHLGHNPGPLSLESLDAKAMDLLVEDRNSHGPEIFHALCKKRRRDLPVYGDLKRLESERAARALIEGSKFHLFGLIVPGFQDSITRLGLLLEGQKSDPETPLLLPEVSEAERNQARIRLSQLAGSTYYQGLAALDSSKYVEPVSQEIDHNDDFDELEELDLEDELEDDDEVQVQEELDWLRFIDYTGPDALLVGLEMLLTAARLGDRDFDEDLLETAWSTVQDWRRNTAELRLQEKLK